MNNIIFAFQVIVFSLLTVILSSVMVVLSIHFIEIEKHTNITEYQYKDDLEERITSYLTNEKLFNSLTLALLKYEEVEQRKLHQYFRNSRLSYANFLDLADKLDSKVNNLSQIIVEKSENLSSDIELILREFLPERELNKVLQLRYLIEHQKCRELSHLYPLGNSSFKEQISLVKETEYKANSNWEEKLLEDCSLEPRLNTWLSYDKSVDYCNVFKRIRDVKMFNNKETK